MRDLDAPAGVTPIRPVPRPVALTLKDVFCTFVSDHGRKRYTALRDASLTLNKREFVSIVGPTGCGKSTLLNVAAGLIAPSEGAVTVDGAPLLDLNRDAAYMFQADALLPWATARANVALGLELRGTAKREAAERAEAWLARVGLAGRGDAYPHQLSGGQKKRVALAQVLVMEPSILLMDEPFSALDIQTRQLMENELLALWEEFGMSVLFVTHDLEEAISLSDRVVLLSAGPGTRPIAEFEIAIPRPRDVTEIVQYPHYVETHRRIWEMLKVEVAKSHAPRTGDAA